LENKEVIISSRENRALDFFKNKKNIYGKQNMQCSVIYFREIKSLRSLNTMTFPFPNSPKLGENCENIYL
jgi:hypothetical protein